MKKVVIGLVALFALVFFASPSFALLRRDIQIARGEVVSTDIMNSQVTIKDGAGVLSTFNVDAGTVRSLMKGQRINIIHKAGSKTAQNVSIQGAGRAGKKGY
ncbi:MAG: hypothetical protein WC676_02040 [Candidatus Omnitrophota bacterium]